MSKQKSVMKHQFSKVPKAEIPRSSFDRSHGNKTAFDAGFLIPTFVDEVLPGDTFTLNPTHFARMATPIFPIMDNMFLDTFYFAVPIRLLHDNWEKLNGAQDNPGDSTDFLTPTIPAPAGGWAADTLSDYFGIPTEIPNLNVSSYWHRAYNKIWADWFRDENLQDSPVLDKSDGPDDNTAYPLLRRGKRHDYFTSALPWPQKGPAVELPLGTSAPIAYNAVSSTELTAFDVQTGNYHDLNTSGSRLSVSGTTGTQADSLYADLTNATAATINSLRMAFQVQKLYERDARGGTRYTETIKSHFGVTSPDQRLQRSEYLGGNSTPINISQVEQTSESTVNNPQGNLAAYATATSTSGGFSKSFTEHCVIIGLCSVRADLSYQQGLNRMWSRSGRFDYFWPALQAIGEQSILNKEIYAQGDLVMDGDNIVDDQVFGYQERFAEYRYKPSTITSSMRSNHATPLDAWHLSQNFGSLPTLSAQFIEDNPPIDRIIAVPSEPQFIMDSYFKLTCARPMPMYGVPGLIDHF